MERTSGEESPKLRLNCNKRFSNQRLKRLFEKANSTAKALVVSYVFRRRIVSYTLPKRRE